MMKVQFFLKMNRIKEKKLTTGSKKKETLMINSIPITIEGTAKGTHLLCPVFLSSQLRLFIIMLGV